MDAICIGIGIDASKLRVDRKVSKKDTRHQGQRPKKQNKGRSRGDYLWSIGLLIVVLVVAVGSVWWGLVPVGQQIQSRQQATVNLNTLPADDPTLVTCISENNIVMRLKVNLRIFVNTTQIRIPARVGESADCISPVHTRDASGDIYVESPIAYQFALRDFFAVWKQAFNKNQLLFLRATGTHKILMTVNGQQNFEYENHVLVNGEQIVITYT